MYDDTIEDLRSFAENCCNLKCYDCVCDCCGNSILTEAADAIENLCKSGWISVKDRLPKKRGEQFYLVALNEVTTDFCQYFGDGHFGIIVKGKEKICDEVTHWMPLPKPPKDSE